MRVAVMCMTLLVLFVPHRGNASEDRNILVDVEELPSNEVHSLNIEGALYGTKIPFYVHIDDNTSKEGLVTVNSMVEGRKLAPARLRHISRMDWSSVTTHWRRYPSQRVFRVRFRYGEEHPGCMLGDDGRGIVTITYVGDRPPEVKNWRPDCA